MSTIQSNHNIQFVTPVINRLVDDLLVKILPAGAHSVFEIAQAGNRNVIHALLRSLPCSVDGSMNFNKTCFVLCEQDNTCKQFASL